jgi:hypothetical protein
LAKTIDLTPRVHVQIFAEVFNVLNTQNQVVGSSNQNLFLAKYTQATDKYTFTKFTTFGLNSSYATTPDPRQFQVAAKFIF